MIALSLLSKTLAFALWPLSRTTAAVLWLIGLFADVWPERGSWSKADGRKDVIRTLATLQISTLVVGIVVNLACDYAAMRWKDGLIGVAGLAAFLMHAVGLPVSSFDGDLFLTNMAGPLRFSVSFDNLGVWVPATMLALGGVFLLLRLPALKSAFRRFGWLALLLLGVALLRLALGTTVFLGLCDFVGYESEELPISPFVRPEMNVVLYLPLLLAIWPLTARLLAIPTGASAKPVARPRVAKLPLAIALPAFGIALLLARWEPAGRPKEGRVVINTYHTEWSRTDRAYDRDWYGADSGYNYACLKRWFSVFKEVREVKTRLTAADLDGASVLMVYLPNVPLGEEERSLITEFVRNGGGLLLIGDHTNVFGSTSHLNEICGPFGFYFRDDVLFDLDADFFQLIDLPGRSTPFTHGMTFYKFRGPASIQPTSFFTRTVLTVDHAKALRAIYSVNNFYPPPHDDPKMKTGRFAVAVASRFGSGRVAAFADSTIFSNFEIFYPGKYEYLLNTLNWLNHEDGPMGAFLRRCGLLAAAGLLLYLLIATSSPRRWLETIVGALLLAWLAGVAVWTVEARRAAFPEPVTPARAVFFASLADEPAYGLRTFTTDAPYEDRFDVFVQWVLRTGAFSGFLLTDEDARTDLYDHLRGAENVDTALAFIARKPEDLDQLRALAKGRGRTATRWLLLFSGKITVEAATAALGEADLVEGASAEQVQAAWPASQALIESGGRKVQIVAGAERFADQPMGFSEKVTPTPTQRALYDRAFALVDGLFVPATGFTNATSTAVVPLTRAAATQP